MTCSKFRISTVKGERIRIFTVNFLESVLSLTSLDAKTYPVVPDLSIAQTSVGQLLLTRTITHWTITYPDIYPPLLT